MKAYWFFILLFFITSCSHTERPGKQNIDDYYLSSGAEQHFLSELPQWANFSTAGLCLRSESLRYFDLHSVAKSYALSFGESVIFQAQYNQRYLSYKKGLGLDTAGNLQPKDEELIFSNTAKLITGKTNDLKLPKFKTVNVIWFDPLKNKPHALKTLLNSTDLSHAYPVLVSFCHSSQELEKLIEKLGIEDTMSTMGAEFLTPYNETLALSFTWIYPLKAIFSSEQQLKLIIPGDKLPAEFFEALPVQYFPKL